MVTAVTAGVSVIDFRRQSMVLQWNAADGTWSAHDVPPVMVHGVALIRAAQPNICLFSRGDLLQLQIGAERFELGDSAPRIDWTRSAASFGLRRLFTVESEVGTRFTHAYWNGQGDDFFAWLVPRLAEQAWRRAAARDWSAGVEPSVLRAG
jgi:hypothetical protein